MRMRFVAILLATTVLFLAFKPAIDAMVLPFSSSPSCCIKTCDAMPALDTAQDEAPKGTCNGNSCNPFQACGTSFLICLEGPEVQFQNVEISTKQNFFYQSIFYSQFVSDFWQPPKFV